MGGLDMLLRDIRLGAMGGDAHRAHAHLVGVLEVMDVSGFLMMSHMSAPEALAQQALHVFPLLFGTQVVMVVVRLLTGAEFPGVLYFLASFVAVLIWHPLNYVLLLPQYRPVERDDNRPI